MPQGNLVEEKIRRFILKQFPAARRRDFRNNDMLLESGILDSLGVLDLVTFMEEEFGMSVSDEELTPDNFRSVEHLVSFIQRKSNTDSGKLP